MWSYSYNICACGLFYTIVDYITCIKIRNRPDYNNSSLSITYVWKRNDCVFKKRFKNPWKTISDFFPFRRQTFLRFTLKYMKELGSNQMSLYIYFVSWLPSFVPSSWSEFKRGLMKWIWFLHFIYVHFLHILIRVRPDVLNTFSHTVRSNQYIPPCTVKRVKTEVLFIVISAQILTNISYWLDWIW